MSIIKGTSDDDLLNGTNLNDKLFGRAGDDTIYGLLGDDDLNGDDGHDVLIGDTQGVITGTIISGVLTRTYGRDSLNGGTGNDLLIGDHGGYDIVTSDGALNSPNVVFTSNYGADMLVGGSGKDILIGDYGFNKFSSINVTATLNYGGNKLIGGDDDDILAVVSAYTDWSFQQDTKIADNIEKSILIGGDGNDILSGQVFSMIYRFGTTLDDAVTGATVALNWISDGHDLNGGNGNDFMVGDLANALFIVANCVLPTYLKLGDDTLKWGDGNDTLIGDTSRQSIFPAAGASDFSQLTHVRGDDVLIGGAGNDILVGDESFINSYYERIDNVAITGVTVAVGQISTGHGNYFGKDTFQGGLGDDLIWGDNMRFTGGTNNNTQVVDGEIVFTQIGFTGTFLAVKAVSNSGTAVGSDTFVFDVVQGWDRDILMDFNGVDPNILVGSPDTIPGAPSNSVPNTVWVQMDNLKFTGVGDLNGDSVLDYHDVDMLILDILPTASEPTVTAGGYFDRATQSYVDPSDSSVHTLDVQGASKSANAFTIPDGRVEVQFSNGSSIIVADVVYAGQTSIANLYATPADAAAHIIVM